MAPTQPTSIQDAIEKLQAGKHALIVFNACYGGGPELSEKGAALSKELSATRPNVDENIILLEVLRQLGPKLSADEYSKYGLALVLKEYKEFIYIREYDGLESLHARPNEYLKHRVEQELEKTGLITIHTYNMFVEESKGIIWIPVDF